MPETAYTPFKFGFLDNIYVEYAIVTKGDIPGGYFVYESGSEKTPRDSQAIYYKIYSLLENKDDEIVLYQGPIRSENYVSPKYDLEIPENEIISIDGIDWILRKCVGFDGSKSDLFSGTFIFGAYIELPDPPGINFKYPDAPKFRNQVTPHVYFDTGVDESTEAFAKNVRLGANTEYTAHKSNARAQGPAVTIDISKTLFDKEEPVEETSK